MVKINENTLAEQPVIDWLRELGYEIQASKDLVPGGAFMERNDYREVVLEGKLNRALKRINPKIPDEALGEVAKKIIKYDHPDIELGNKEMYEMLTHGIKVDVKENGNSRTKIVRPIDFEKIDNNEFLVVNQFTVQGSAVRIPDVVVFINGIPIAIFELKSPTRENATIADAYGQLHDIYKRDIPKIFFYNQILVVSDLLHAKHGTVSATFDFFSVWKGIESENEETRDKSELELLTKGIFEKQRLLDIIENFIVFEADAVKDATKFTKKMAMYNQYYGVNKAIDNTIRAVNGNKKIGVFWHTQGSGKSLAMVFYTNKVRKLEELKSPTILFLTDRNDLDNQLHKTFLRTGHKTAKMFKNIRDLMNKIENSGAEIFFSTIQKFDFDKALNDRNNFIVVADEAHRSQYAVWAGNLHNALPNASFMGITGTPIELNDRNTRLVFGDYISEYKIDKSQKDKVTVPIYYEGRLVPLHVLNEFVDEEVEELLIDYAQDTKQTAKVKWAKLEEAIGSSDRLEKIADDIVYHYNNRGLEGKALVVTMSRKIASSLYQLIAKKKNAPEVAVVVSNNKEFEGKIQEELDNKELEKRFKNPDDPLKIVIVCDMWITGFDVPNLHTIYLDKPLKGHTLMQAIARVNRRFKDKRGGLIVDYIGIADNLKKALAIYTSDIQKQALIPIEKLIEKMLETYKEVKKYFDGMDYKSWKKQGSGEQAVFFQKAINNILTDDATGKIAISKKREYLKLAGRLYKLFSLVMPHKDANAIRDEVEFFEGVRRGIIKSTIVNPKYIDKKTETAIRDLISKNIVAEGVIDIFAQYRKERPDISILDDKFLEEVKDSKYKNLTVEAVHKILEDELKIRERTNKLRYKTLLEKLEEIIEEYENNIINSSKVIERLIELAREIRKAEKAGEDLGLSSEEMAFYDALSEGKKALKNKDIKIIVKELTKTIKRELGIDWTNHEVIKAKIRTDVRMILLRHNVSFDDVEKITSRIYDQAYYLYKEYPTYTNYI